MSQQGWSNDTQIGSGTLKSAANTNSIFTYSSGTGDDGASEGPKYFTSGTNIRFYSKKNGDGNGNYMQINVPSNTTITGIEITGDNNYTPDVKYNVDGGSDVSWTASNNKYTVSNISATTSFKFRNAYKNTSDNKQLRITAIKITYTTSSGGGSEPSITLGTYSVNAPATAVSTTSIEVTYNNLTDYESEVNFYESDGETEATYDHSWLTAEINSTTKNLDYSITANTGAARTAYLRVYAIGEEGEAESDLITINQEAAPAPSITASNVNIGYNATDGSIGYSLANATGNISATITTGDWLTLGTITEDEVPFTCSANTATTARTATVTLSYTGATDKVVTVTQAGRPNYISEITASGTAYTVVGTVVATNSRGFVIGDGTGYVYTYLNAAPSQAVNDKVKIAGTTGTYGQIIQFTNSATITTESTSAYEGTPAATVINAVPDYSTGLHLSTYLQFEGELEKSNSNYYITVGSDQIQISYPTTAQSTALSALDGKTVRVKGYFSGNNSSGYFSVMLESVEEVTNPTIAVNPATAEAFTYVVGSGPSDEQMFTITGTNLVSEDISATVSSDYEITDDTEYSSSVTVASGDIVSVRLKAGLEKGTHNGTLTLSSTDATDVVINLSGTVSGQSFAINVDDDVTGGTIEADLASAEEGSTVTLTAHPNAAYTFGSWTVVKDDLTTPVTVTNNQFTMPDCEVYVTATFNAKPTYDITCVADPDAGGTIVADENAYEGQTVTIQCEAATGYRLSSIVITKTEDGSATGITPTASGEDYIFTMPGYAVTATATFNEVYTSGTFAKYTSAITEGYYVITYNDNALKNTVNSNRFTNGSFTTANDLITDPDPSIVWYIKPNGNYWTIFNDDVSKYAAGTSSKNQGALIESVTDLAKWTATISSGTFQFENLGRSNASSDSGNKWLRNNGTSGWACYADATGGALTLYKMTTLTERTITFNGNGGTYNNETTYTQDVYDGITATLNANQFTRSGYEFAGWNNQANGEGASSYDDEDNITVTGGDLTLYAQWAPLYSLTIDNNIEGGSVSVTGNVTSATEGTEITLSYSANSGYVFDAWDVYKAGDELTKVTVGNNNKFTMPAYNVVVSATFREVQTYSLVTNVNQIVSGKHYIIASGSNGSIKAMGSQNSSHYRNVVAVTANDGVIPETTGVYEFVIYGPSAITKNNVATQVYTIYDVNYSTDGGYLYASSSNSNYLETQADNDNNGKWTISIAETGAATINAQGTNTRNMMRFNSDRFACYGSNTTVNALPYLYVKDGEATPTEEVTIGASGFATFCSQNALDFTNSDAKAYTAKVNNGSVRLTRVNKVPAGVGVVLHSETSGNYNISTVAGAADAVTENEMVGVLTRTQVLWNVGDKYNYILQQGVFNKATNGYLKANRAYLSTSYDVSAPGARALQIVFSDESTGIDTIEHSPLTIDRYYNLSGQRVDNPKKGGLYIVNGKKVVIK